MKTCPLLAIAFGHGKEEGELLCTCRESACAWWYKDDCAITYITAILDTIAAWGVKQAI